jgi:hypothetical protein
VIKGNIIGRKKNGMPLKNLASLIKVRQNISLTHQNIVMSSKDFHSSQLILYYNYVRIKRT